MLETDFLLCWKPTFYFKSCLQVLNIILNEGALFRASFLLVQPKNSKYRTGPSLSPRQSLSDFPFLLSLGKSSKKKQIFYGQADRKGWPPLPPPLRSGDLCFFSEGYIWLRFMIIHSLKLILTQKKFLDHLYDPIKDFGWVKMSISSSYKRDNGTKIAMMRSALNSIFKPLHH